MKKVIIDVDTGIDDALALILAFKSKKLDIRGVTTVAGNTPLKMVTENTLRVLKLIGKEEIEVYEGCSKPIKRKGGFLGLVHGERGLAGQLMEMSTKDKNNLHGVDYIIEEVNKFPGEITLIMLAPLTNLARAIEKDPTIVEKVKEVYIMGGAFHTSGNITPVAEFNFYADPEAAYKVLKSGINPKILGLDVTNKARLYEEQLKNIGRETELGKFVNNVLEVYIDKSSTNRDDKSGALHDPLVVATVLDESIVEFREEFIDIEHSSRLCDGQSVSYFNRTGYAANAQVAVVHDDEKFQKMFLDAVGGK